jgi:hypothetical protein
MNIKESLYVVTCSFFGLIFVIFGYVFSQRNSRIKEKIVTKEKIVEVETIRLVGESINIRFPKTTKAKHPPLLGTGYLPIILLIPSEHQNKLLVDLNISNFFIDELIKAEIYTLGDLDKKFLDVFLMGNSPANFSVRSYNNFLRELCRNGFAVLVDKVSFEKWLSWQIANNNTTDEAV